MVLVTISRVVFSAESAYVRERTFSFASRVESRMEDKIASISDVLPVAAHALEKIDPEAPGAEDDAVQVLVSLLRSNGEIHNVWFAFEPGEFSRPGRFAKSYLRSGDIPVEIFDMRDDLLNDLEHSPWYNISKTTEEFFFDLGGLYDYGAGLKARYVGSFSFPLRRNGRTIGCVGFDVPYDHLFRSIDATRLPGAGEVLLLSAEGQVFYPPGREHRNLLPPDFSPQPESLHYREGISPLSGKTSLLCLYPLKINPGQDFFLYIDLPMETLYARACAAVRVIFATSLLGLILLTASLFFTVRNIVKPIKKITNNAHKLAQGELDVVFDSTDENASTKNEIVILQAALKKMLDQIYQIQDLKLQAVRSTYERERVEETMRAKVRFFGAISHEIRTPMNAVLGLSDLLLDEPLSAKQRKFVNDIRFSADSLLDIVDDVLDFTKMETDRMELSRDHYDPRSLLENIRSMTSSMARKKGLAFEFVVADDIPSCLYGDALKLRQIMLNLLGNAIKYTHNGFVRFAISYEDGYLSFEVTDSGIGMKEEDLPVIFEAFRQLPQEKSRHIQGTGLGLTITKSLVALMEGEITVRSVYGEGSCFSVRVPLPLGDADALEKGPKRSVTFRVPTAKVLVVDDNEINLNVAEGLLSRFDISADTAISGQEALRKIKNFDYDIVFMDHMMPGMDGVEAVRKIREMGGRYESLVVIALTANAIDGVRELLLSRGMNDFLPKPVNRNALGNMLLKWLPVESVNFDDLGDEVPPDSDSETSKLVASLSEIRELDVALGMDRVSCSSELYRRIAEQMHDTIPAFCEEVDSFLRNGDCENFKIRVHGMKNSLANVGAMALSERAKKLETAAASGDLEFCGESLPDFMERLRAFEKKLGRALNGAIAHKTAGNTDLLRTGIRKLNDALSDNDYMAILEALRELLQYGFEEENNDKLKNIELLIERFEYESALETLRLSWPDILNEDGNVA